MAGKPGLLYLVMVGVFCCCASYHTTKEQSMLQERPSMSRAKNGKGKSKVSRDEAASRVGWQVYHTGQGQNERAHPRPGHLLRGLDLAWSVTSNPHRESGTRWWAAADVGAATRAAHGRQRGYAGNRLGDSVGAGACSTGEGLRSAECSHRGMTGRGNLTSGGGLTGRVRPLRRFKGGGLIAGFADPHGIENTHPDVGQGAQRHTVGLALGPFAPVVIQCP